MTAVANPLPDWAGRLFTGPARWGWQAVVPQAVVPRADLDPQRRPVLTAPPLPDTGRYRGYRRQGVRNLIEWAIVGVVTAVVGVLLSGPVSKVHSHVLDGAFAVVLVLLIVASVWQMIRCGIAIGRWVTAINRLERPYQAFFRLEADRVGAAADQFDRARQAYAEEIAAQAQGPRWIPVGPVVPPIRVEVFGGDPNRHGWASLLTTLGTSVLAAGQRVTVLDLTGHDVAGGLLQAAAAHGMPTRQVDPAVVDPLVGLTGEEVADDLADALTARAEAADLRHERTLAREALSRVVSGLDGHLTCARVAAGLQVLRRTTPTGDVLGVEETNRLTEQVGELGDDEWTTKQLRYLTGQLGRITGAEPTPLWTDGVAVNVVAGRPDEDVDLLDRILVRLAQRALGRGVDGLLVVAGGDRLGAATLGRLADRARHAGVRLLLMIDQPQGDVEKTVGTGGAVCFMKLYNHRDAQVAADFIGRGHKFVLSQLTVQAGQSLTDGHGTNAGESENRGISFGHSLSFSGSRGRTWSATRNWSTGRNDSQSRGMSRVYEFTVDPQQLLALPETAFLLVDNTGPERRVVLADSNPGLSAL